MEIVLHAVKLFLIAKPAIPIVVPLVEQDTPWIPIKEHAQSQTAKSTRLLIVPYVERDTHIQTTLVYGEPVLNLIAPNAGLMDAMLATLERYL
jgi:hypothetical protein